MAIDATTAAAKRATETTAWHAGDAAVLVFFFAGEKVLVGLGMRRGDAGRFSLGVRSNEAGPA